MSKAQMSDVYPLHYGQCTILFREITAFVFAHLPLIYSFFVSLTMIYHFARLAACV